MAKLLFTGGSKLTLIAELLTDIISDAPLTKQACIV